MRNIYLSVLSASAVLSSAIVIADGKPPSTPQLFYNIYSSTAAELSWSRSTDENIELIYQLSRNGEQVFSGDALSYYEPSLVAGQNYTYTLTVVGKDGLVSEAIAVDFDTNDRSSVVTGTLLPPTGVRAEVYSSNALELFWDRVPNAALSYEIYQDGRFVGITDGTSLYLNTAIEGDGIYTYEVIAVRYDDSETVHSSPETISVNIAARLGLAGAPPTAPENISLTRYSSTAAELFWSRPATEEYVVATDIIRNGILIDSVQGGISFFDDTRSAGESYTYELVAIDSFGERSAMSLYTDGDDVEPPVSAGPMFAGMSVSTARASVNNIVTGNPLGTESGILDVISYALAPSFLDDLISGTATACPLGGSIEYLTDVETGMFRQDTDNYTYNSCVFSEGMVNGEITIVTFVSDSTRSTETSTGVSVSGDRFDAVLNGTDKTSTLNFSNYLAGPECTRITASESLSRTYQNSEIVDKTSGDTIVHSYPSLSYSVVTESVNDCLAETQTTTYRGDASYELTDAETTVNYQITKSGLLLDGDLSESQASSSERAQLEATVNYPGQLLSTMSIVASDLRGSSLNLSIDNGAGVQTLIENISFKNL